MTPQIETTDNAFKIILPNLNVISELEEPTQTRLEKDIPEKKGDCSDKGTGFCYKKRG